jgi:hypothetical protein
VKLRQQCREVGVLLGAVSGEPARQLGRQGETADDAVVDRKPDWRRQPCGQIWPDRGAKPEVAAQHDPIRLGEEDMGHHRVAQTAAVVADVAADDRRHGRIVEGVGREADRGRRTECDADALDAGANVLDRVVHRAPVALRPGGDGRLDRVVDVRQRVPEPITIRIVGVPVEPPLDHLGADTWHRRAHGDVSDPIGHEAPAGLGLQRSWVEQAVDLPKPQRLRRLDRPSLDRGEHRWVGPSHWPREVGLERGIAHQRRPIQGWKMPSGS